MRTTAMMAVLALGVSLMSGCLAIGNRGGLSDDDKQLIGDLQRRVSRMEGRLDAMNPAGAASGDEVTVRQLREQIEKLRKENEELQKKVKD